VSPAAGVVLYRDNDSLNDRQVGSSFSARILHHLARHALRKSPTRVASAGASFVSPRDRRPAAARNIADCLFVEAPNCSTFLRKLVNLLLVPAGQAVGTWLFPFFIPPVDKLFDEDLNFIERG